MSASRAARAASAFLSTLMIFGTTARAFAHTGNGPRSTLTATAVVLTKCSVDGASALSCSEPLEVERDTSVQTLLVDGQPRRVVVSTINF